MPVHPPSITSRSDPVDAIVRVGERTGRPPTQPRTPTPHDGARVEISLAGQAALVRSETTQRVLDAVARELGLSVASQEQAGRADFLDRVRSPRDLSPEASARRIYEGIIGYLYEAFRLEHPNPRRQQIEEFVDASSRGLDRGLRDAASLLLAFGARREELAAERDETFRRVRDLLVRFEAEQLEGSKPVAAEPLAPAAASAAEAGEDAAT